MAHPSNSGLQVSPQAISVLTKYEGFYPDAYRDFAGVVTIGYGTTNRPDLGISVRMGDRIDEPTARALMMKELREFERDVLRLVRVPINQGQLDGMAVLSYNIGTTAFAASTLLKKVNRGDFDGAAEEFERWSKARDKKTGKLVTLKGLVSRRRDEAAMFRAKTPNEDVPKNPVRVPRDQMVPPPDVKPIAKPVVAPRVEEPKTDWTFSSILVAVTATIVSTYHAIMTKAETFLTSPLTMYGAALLAGLVLGYVLRDFIRPR